MMHALYNRKKWTGVRDIGRVGGERSYTINWMVRAGLLLEGTSEKKKQKELAKEL